MMHDQKNIKSNSVFPRMHCIIYNKCISYKVVIWANLD